jgi:hypothetical protein
MAVMDQLPLFKRGGDALAESNTRPLIFTRPFDSGRAIDPIDGTNSTHRNRIKQLRLANTARRNDGDAHSDFHGVLRYCSLNMARPRIQFDISADEREQLLAMVCSQGQPPSWVLRAKVLLMAADGHSNNDISHECSITSAAVTYWKRRFLAGGIHGLVNGSVDGRFDFLRNKEALQIEQVCNAWITAQLTQSESS